MNEGEKEGLSWFVGDSDCRLVKTRDEFQKYFLPVIADKPQNQVIPEVVNEVFF